MTQIDADTLKKIIDKSREEGRLLEDPIFMVRSIEHATFVKDWRWRFCNRDCKCWTYHCDLTCGECGRDTAESEQPSEEPPPPPTLIIEC